MALGRLSRAKLPKEAQVLVAHVRNHLRDLDAEMLNPSTVDRGKQIAKLCNALEMAVDSFEHFGIKTWVPNPRGVGKQKTPLA